MSKALKEARAAKLARLEELATIAEERSLTDDESTEVEACKADIRDIDKRAALLAEMVEARKSPIVDTDDDVEDPAEIRKVVASPRVEVREREIYTQDSGNSWFRDRITLRDNHASDAEVKEARGRLEKHYAAHGTDAERRALASTSDATGGYLVAPAHLQDQFLRMLTAGAPTYNLCRKMPLPAKTDQINIPSMDGATSVAVHTQNNSLSETSATFNTVQASVVRYGGSQTIPNFLLDRSVPGIDQIVTADLANRLVVKIDTDVLNGTTPEGILNADGVGTATYTAGTATAAGLWPVLLNAITDVRSSHYKEPEAIVMHPRRWGWLLGQVDGDNRPFLGAFGPVNAYGSYSGGAPQGDDGAPRTAGNILGIPVVLDSNIPITLGSGTDEDAIIVGVFSEAFAYTGSPKFAVSVDEGFTKDQTIVRVTQDFAFTAERYPGAFSLITGTGLNDTL